MGLNLHTDPGRAPGWPGPIRLAVVDDHEVFRMGLRSVFERVQGIEVAWDASSAHDAFDLLQRQPVDVILMDMNLGGPVDGLQATRRLVAAQPQLKVILISGLADERRLGAAKEAGASGFLPKELSAEEMVGAIRRMVSGAVVGLQTRSGAPARATSPVAGGAPFAAFETLSPREVEVLAEMRLARTNREIAERLGVSTTTVNKHVHQILRKLGLRNRAEAAIVAGSLLSQPRQTL
jgi:DNA-binding NarL/FixJ family response regulator